MIVPGNRFEYLEARAALDAIDDGELDPENLPARHARRARPAYPGRGLRRRRSRKQELLAEVRSAAPYAGLKDETFTEVLNFIATGGYALARL